MNRDLTERQYQKALAERGFKNALFGFWNLPLSNGTSVDVFAANGGDRRRDKLAYLIREQARMEERVRGAR